jgi:hypothetical protein
VVVGFQKAAAVIRGLEEIGLVAGQWRIEELVEERAQERLKVLKAEHGLPQLL